MRNGVIVVVVILVVLFLFARQPAGGSPHDTPQSGPSSTTTGHLSVVPTIRSITVSPGSVTFGGCTGGGGATDSTKKAMGYPNGSCYVGSISRQAYPIAVTYSGLPGEVFVTGSDAQPADGGHQWTLCSPQAGSQGSGPALCTGGNGLPGQDQYWVENFAQGANSAVLTTTATCDQEFDSSGGCSASPAEFSKQTQHEGLLLTGPKTWDDHSTSWTMTVTWTAVGP